tara:strand:+ start:208 stop:666 length:459 start_codon:yes stop_codon:yes gene_type:complete
MGNTPFKLKSGNTTPFKMMGSSPLKQSYPSSAEMGSHGPKGTLDEVKRIAKQVKSTTKTTTLPGGHHHKVTTGPEAMKPPKGAMVKKAGAKDLMKRGVGRLLAGPIGWGLTIAELGYDFGKRSLQRKKEGKSGFNITKGRKTSTPKNQGFNF